MGWDVERMDVTGEYDDRSREFLAHAAYRRTPQGQLDEVHEVAAPLREIYTRFVIDLVNLFDTAARIVARLTGRG